MHLPLRLVALPSEVERRSVENEVDADDDSTKSDGITQEYQELSDCAHCGKRLEVGRRLIGCLLGKGQKVVVSVSGMVSTSTWSGVSLVIGVPLSVILKKVHCHCDFKLKDLNTFEMVSDRSVPRTDPRLSSSPASIHSRALNVGRRGERLIKAMR